MTSARPIPDEVLRHVEARFATSMDAVYPKGDGTFWFVHDLARELLACREALRAVVKAEPWDHHERPTCAMCHALIADLPPDTEHRATCPLVLARALLPENAK